MRPPEIDRLLEGHTDEIREVFERVRTVVLARLPGVTEQVDMPDRLVAYGYDEGGGVRMRDLLVAIVPHKAHVNVQFVDGADLPDPDGLLEGTGKRIRHVKNRTLADAERPALRRLITAQVERRRPIGG